jgi:hypothetical protein
MTPEEAIDTVARHVVGNAVETFVEDGWDLYPEIGEQDWERVVAKTRELVPEHTVERYREAYKILEDRAIEPEGEVDV